MINYLLGRLPEQDAEHLDELSMTDDAFAARLSATENDLVDAYVRGELSGEVRERFRSFYLASPLRQEKVRFAEALLAHERRGAALSPATEHLVGSGLWHTDPGRFPRQRRRGLFQWFPTWGVATAALLFVTVLLLIQNRRLNVQIRQSESERARLTQNQQALELDLQKQRAAGAATAAEQRDNSLAAGGAMSKTQIPGIPAFILSPMLRGVDSIATIAVQPGVMQIRVKLQLETSDFSRYRVTLKDPATDHIRWRSGEIRAQDAGDSKSVSVLLSTRLLRQQNYAFELSGITDHGTLEFIGSYPFRVMVK